MMPTRLLIALLVVALTLPSCALGPPEIAIIALVVLVLFGGSQLPKLMRGMGSGINEFKKGLKEGDTSDGDGKDEDKDEKKKDD